MTNRLDELLEFADSLPALPTVVVAALQLLNDDDSDTDDIADVLSGDQALVAQLLKLSNSPFYGVSRRVSTIKQALMILGRKAVRGLIIAAAAEGIMSGPQTGYLLEANQLWEHSNAVGRGAALVAVKVGYRPVEEAFVAGLLHDIGKVVLSGFLADCAEDLQERLDAAEGTPFTEVEAELLQIDHARVGGAVAEHWQLPKKLADAIEYHHAPSTAGDDWQLAGVVHVANALALSMGVGLGVDGLHYTLDEPAIQRLGLTAEDLMSLTEGLLAALAEADVA